MFKRISGFIFVVMIAFLGGCSSQNKEADITSTNRIYPIKIVATIGMITDAVQIIGGEHVRVEGLMGPGIDPHLYKASEGDVMKLASADMIFYNGLHLEAKMGEIFDKMKGRVKTAAVSDSIDRQKLLSFPAFPDQYDPHIWFDVELWMAAVEKIQDELSKFDPVHSADYQKRATAYLGELKALHDYVSTKSIMVSESKRVIVTAHDAFNYFGRAYGYEVVGLQGISTESEAGTADVQRVAQLISSRQIPAIFIESSIPRRNIEAVQEAVRARGWDVKIGGQLYSDAMGNPGTPEGSYLGMVRYNVDTIIHALSGGQQ